MRWELGEKILKGGRTVSLLGDGKEKKKGPKYSCKEIVGWTLLEEKKNRDQIA